MLGGPACMLPVARLTVRTSQRDTVLSAEQVARVSEKGRKRAWLTELVWPRSVARFRPVAESQSLQLWSMPAEARRAPDQCQHALQTGCWCSSNVSTGRPWVRSQMHTVPSPEAVASFSPLGGGAVLLLPAISGVVWNYTAK